MCATIELMISFTISTDKTGASVKREFRRFRLRGRGPGTSEARSRRRRKEDAHSYIYIFTSTSAFAAGSLPPCYALHGVRVENERRTSIDGLGFSILPHRAGLVIAGLEREGRRAPMRARGSEVCNAQRDERDEKRGSV